MSTKERIRELLVEAVLQSDGGPTQVERVEAEDIADDVMRTPAWGDLMHAIDEHYRAGFAAAANRDHGIGTCRSCAHPTHEPDACGGRSSCGCGTKDLPCVCDDGEPA